jgi:predicted RecA/RadA family phage recombinase
MRNFIQTGDNITVAAPADVKSGDLVFVGSLFGVAATDAATGEDVALVTRGVFALPKDNTSPLNVGDVANWDASDRHVTNVADTDVSAIGHVVEAADAAATSVAVRLSV